MMDNYSITSAGVDYFTATTRDDYVFDKWYNDWHEALERRDVPKVAIEPWGNRYYNGYQYEGSMLGVSESLGYIFIAKGANAKYWWSKMMPRKGRVTRIDAQVTCLFERPDPDWAARLYERAKSNKARSSQMIQNSRGGTTVYIGSRQSDQFGRLYDKGVQSKLFGPGKLWRYETQFGKPRSGAFADSLYDAWQAGRDTEKEIVGLVYRWWQSRGVTTPFFESGGSLVAEVEKTITTVDRRLDWLRSQIAPTVNRLIAQGHGKETLEALGLTWGQIEMFAPKYEVVDRQNGQGMVH